jgi:phosphate/sulfate permease
LTIKRAVIVAAVLEFSGAFLVGSHVSETIRKGIISPDLFLGHEMDLALGMIGALLAAGAWLQLASYFGWPVSTTHSIVGAVLGFGVMYGGVNAADWGQVGSIVASWVISPLLCGTIAFLLFTLLRKTIYGSENPVESAKRITPYLVFFVFFILTLTLVFKGLKNLNLNLGFGEAMMIAALVGLIAAVVSHFLVKRIKTVVIKERITVRQSPKVSSGITKSLKHLNRVYDTATGEIRDQVKSMLDNLNIINKEIDRGTTVEQGSAQYQTVEKIFIYLQILSAAFVAFAHGANDVANAVGPLASVISLMNTGVVAAKAAVPLWVLGLGGVGIVFGLATWGWRVMMTIGKKITELTPTRGFCAEFAAATTIVLASKMGLPISTTHTLVGGVLGVGLARGISALNLRVVTNIVISWIVTIPVGAIGAIAFYFLLKSILL